MPHRNRNPGSGKPPTGLKASGVPAGGQIFGPGKASNGSGRAAPITPETAPTMQALHGTPEAEAKRERRIASAQELKGVLSDIALDDGAIPVARIQAADKLLDRLEGKPVQRNVNFNHTDLSGLTDAELARIASQGGADAPRPEDDPPVIR